MNGSNHKVIGYFAIRRGSPYILCDGDACVIAGSEQSMNSYIVKLANDKPSNYKVKKTRYGEIVKGMRMGAVYTFDKKAYKRFFPLAKAEGAPVMDFKFEDDEKPHEDAVRLMRVKWFDSDSRWLYADSD